jgi:hypothetical protein
LNGALVYSFMRHKFLRSSHNVYVMFIVTLGLFASCTILPWTGVSSIHCRWLFKRVGCQASAVIAFLYGCSSSYLLCAGSISRCYVILRPFNAHKVTVSPTLGNREEKIFHALFSTHRLKNRSLSHVAWYSSLSLWLCCR